MLNKKLLSLLLFLALFLPTYAQVWSLQQCIDSAQVYNKNLQITRNNIQIGEQKHQEAYANLIPKINVNADYRYYTDQPYQMMLVGSTGKYKESQIGVPHNINANLQITMPLYNPQLYGAVEITGIASELSGLQYQKTEEQIYFEISNLYYNAQIIRHQLSFMDSNLVNTQKLLVNIQLLKEQMLAKGTDVAKLQLQMEQLVTQKELAQNRYDQVINALKFTIGIPGGQTMQINPDIQYQKKTEYTSSPVIDILLAKTQNSLLSSELSTLKMSRLPSLSLFGTYGTTGFGYDKKPNDFLDFYPISFVGLQLSYPLFNGTVTQRKISQKQIELKNSTLQLNLLNEQNSMQIDNANRQLTLSSKTIETTQSQIKLARTIYEQTVLQQKQGTAGLTEVLLADNTLREAQQANLTAIIDYLKADLDLKKLSGNISNPKRINDENK